MRTPIPTAWVSALGVAAIVSGCGPREPSPPKAVPTGVKAVAPRDTQPPSAACPCPNPPCYPENPIYYAPLPPEYTPILYASVPTLTTSGQEFIRGPQRDEMGNPTPAVLTYRLYQVNLANIWAGTGYPTSLLSDSVTPLSGWTTTALLKNGLCFVLSQEYSMSTAEVMNAIGNPVLVNGQLQYTTLISSYGGGAGGVPSGPGCATPPATLTAAEVATASVTIVVN